MCLVDAILLLDITQLVGNDAVAFQVSKDVRGLCARAEQVASCGSWRRLAQRLLTWGRGEGRCADFCTYELVNAWR